MTDDEPSATSPPDDDTSTVTWLSELGNTLARISIDSTALSACRRGLGKQPMDIPAMWPYVVPLRDKASAFDCARVETAAHHTLALYAMHQQTRRERSTPSVHQRRADGKQLSLGEACRRLAHKDRAAGELDTGVRRRFHAAATSVSVDELVGHLRGLVTLLRGAGIPLDYQQLAQDLVDWQSPERRTRVRRQWGRDFHRISEPSHPTTAAES